MTTSPLISTGLWQDLLEVPNTTRTTLQDRRGIDDVARLLGGAQVRRVVATGNGASYYAAHALWLASLRAPDGPPVVAVPGGLLARGRFPWREGDVLLAVSSSGEFRDVIDAIEMGGPRPYGAITSEPGSTIGAAAAARAHIATVSQRALTHTQVYCAAVALALAIWARVSGDEALVDALEQAPEVLQDGISHAARWVGGGGVEGATDSGFSAAVVFGAGEAWTAALEGALLVREVSRVPAEGTEMREGATSSMFGLSEGHLVLSMGSPEDELFRETEEICRRAGATVLRVPTSSTEIPQLGAMAPFPGAVAIAADLALRAGHDVDQPSWADAYYSTARPLAPSESEG